MSTIHITTATAKKMLETIHNAEVTCREVNMNELGDELYAIREIIGAALNEVERHRSFFGDGSVIGLDGKEIT